MSSNVPTSTPVILSSIGAIITFSVYIAKLLKEENSSSYKDNIQGKIIILTLGYLFMCVSMVLYIIQEPHNSMYILLLLTCLSIGITFASLSISIVSKL